MAYDGYLNQLRAKNYANYRRFNSTDITLNGPNSFTCLPGGNTSSSHPRQTITLNSPAEHAIPSTQELLPIYPNPNNIQINGETSFTIISPPNPKPCYPNIGHNSLYPCSSINKNPCCGKICSVVGNQSGMIYNFGIMRLDPGLYHIYYTVSFKIQADIDIVRIMYGINNEPDFGQTAPNDLPYNLSVEPGVCLNYTGSQLIHLHCPTHIYLNGGLCFDSSLNRHFSSSSCHYTNGGLWFDSSLNTCCTQTSSITDGEYKIDGTLVAVLA